MTEFSGVWAYSPLTRDIAVKPMALAKGGLIKDEISPHVRQDSQAAF